MKRHDHKGASARARKAVRRILNARKGQHDRCTLDARSEWVPTGFGWKVPLCVFIAKREREIQARRAALCWCCGKHSMHLDKFKASRREFRRWRELHGVPYRAPTYETRVIDDPMPIVWQARGFIEKVTIRGVITCDA